VLNRLHLSLPRRSGSHSRLSWSEIWHHLKMSAVSEHPGEMSFEKRIAHFRQIARSDLDQFEAFFRRFEPTISNYLRRFLGDEQTAYDLAQETFLRAWQRFDEVREHPSPTRWLFRVATNLAQHHLRHDRLIGFAILNEDETALAEGDLSVRLAESDLVYQTLMGLPPRQRALLLLREVHGFSCEEAAQILGVSPGAAKKMLYRARLLFRQLYLRKDGHL
jgi:RNA polymerase sigma-70 factor (ECF subfamily)